MRVVFGSVIYNERIEFIDDFLDSLNKQNYPDFDIIFINDDLNNLKINYIVNKLIQKTIICNVNKKLKPNELRVELIKQSKIKEYDLLILGDFDDTFSEDRVSSIINEFEASYGFFYNDLFYFNNKRLFFDKLPNLTLNIKNILECNYLGLSNTSINLKLIDDYMIKELNNCMSPIFDWYMYSLFLSKGIVGKKINQGFTSYRLHSNNIAGLKKDKNEAILQEIEIKMLHYSSLKKINLVFEELYYNYNELKKKVEIGMNITKYLCKNTSNYWWGNIRLDVR